MDSNYLYTTTSNVGIVDSTDVIIDPATEAKQDSLETLTQALYELIERLSFLASIRGTSGDIRTTITGGSVGVNINANQTLATLSNQTSIGGYLGNNQIPSMMNNSAIISNINNITITP